jgi:lambda family phage portal protein
VSDSNVVQLRKRHYEAASKTSRTKNWRSSSSDATSAIVNAALIRNRARDLVRNNTWAAKGVSVIVNNVVGSGIRAQWQGRTKRQTARTNELWKLWAETTQCDAQGLNTFYGIQQTVMRCVVESGECLVRMRTRRPEDGLAVPFQLQVLEPDHLYPFNDKQLEGGGYIQRGIEYDAIGRRVAYYLYKMHPGSINRHFMFGNKNSYMRVPAGEVIHCFRIDRAGQERGVSWLAPVMIRLRELDIFEDAYLNRQKLANLFAAFISTDNPDEAEEEFSDMDELISGAMYLMKTGRQITFSDPPKADDYGPFTLACLRAVTAGLGITYESMTGDLSEVNFSSARMGWQEFGRNVETWRWQMLIPQLAVRVGEWFKQIADMPDAKQGWTPPARMMVDPMREIPPIISSVRSGLMSLSEALRARGYDPDQVLNQIKADNDKLDELGLILDSDPRNTSGQGQTQTMGLNNDNANTTNT